MIQMISLRIRLPSPTNSSNATCSIPYIIWIILQTSQKIAHELWIIELFRRVHGYRSTVDTCRCWAWPTSRMIKRHSDNFWRLMVHTWWPCSSTRHRTTWHRTKGPFKSRSCRFYHTAHSLIWKEIRLGFGLADGCRARDRRRCGRYHRFAISSNWPIGIRWLLLPWDLGLVEACVS